jgi:hypothetical protein
MSEKNAKSTTTKKRSATKKERISNGAYRGLVLELHRDAKEAIRTSLKKAAFFYLSLDGSEVAKKKGYQCMIDVCKEVQKDNLLYKFLAQKTRQGMNKAGETTGWVPFYLLQAIYKQKETLNGKFKFNVSFTAEQEEEIKKELETV